MVDHTAGAAQAQSVEAGRARIETAQAKRWYSFFFERTSIGWVWPAIVIVAVAVLLYGPLITGSRMLVDYDLFVYFYPYHDYVARALQSGRLPLWNPDLFAGAPLLANLQTGMFYPLNWPGFLISTPRAIGLSIVVHIVMAGAFTYLFARQVAGIGRAGALLAAIAFAYGGFISQQIGHPNQLQTSTWLPLILLLFDRACRRQSWPAAAAAALVVGVQSLAGHPQETYFSLVAVAIYAVVLILPWQGITSAVRPIVALGIVSVLGLGIAAVQFLPTMELSSRSIRAGGLTGAEAGSFSLPPPEALRAFLPTYGSPPYPEYIGYVGIITLVLALAAVISRPRDRVVLVLVLIGAAASILAFGTYNPFYPWLLEFMPGLELFRVPARWLFLVSFSLAVLGGIGLDLIAKRQLVPLGQLMPIPMLAIAIVPIAMVLEQRGLMRIPAMPVPIIWIGTVGFAYGMLAVASGRIRASRLAAGALLIVAIVELTVAGRMLGIHQWTTPSLYEEMPPGVGRILEDSGLYRVMSMASTEYEVGSRAIVASRLSELSSSEVENYLIAHKYLATLSPNTPLHFGLSTLDGYDGGVLPLKTYDEIKPLLQPSDGGAPPSKLEQPDALLRLQLNAVPDTRVLGLLNVKYIIVDRRHDGAVAPGPIVYDLISSRMVEHSQPLLLEDLPDIEATTIGLATALEGAAHLPDGTPVARVTVVDAAGQTTTSELRAGLDTAESRYGQDGKPEHRLPRAIANLPGAPTVLLYEGRIQLPGPAMVQSIEIELLTPADRLRVQGVTLIDDRTLKNETVPLDPKLKRIEMGDLKVYENLDVVPRAFVTHRAIKANNLEELYAAVQEDPLRVVLEEDAAISSAGRGGDTAITPVDVVLYEPERVVLRTSLNEPGWLVLTDSNYPGWNAVVDGQPATILRANHLFRAVKLEAGEHTVEFRFEPTSLRLGAILSVASLIVVIGLAGGSRLIGRRRRSDSKSV